MGKGSSSSNYLLLLVSVAVVAIASFLGYVVKLEPELDWETFVLPMTNEYYNTGKEKSSTPLQGINAVISGATSGIGRGMAEGLTRLGAHVVCIGRNSTKLEQLQQELGGSNSLTVITADYNDLDTVAKAADEILEQFDHIDVLLNNAGIHEGVLLLHNPVSKQGYDRIYSVNYLSHVLLTEKLAPIIFNNNNAAAQPIIAQMSSSFHWVGDWSDLVPGVNGEAPPASRPGGTGGLFRTQRGYGNSKLAMIFYARALKRRHPELQSARIVSICPAWVGTNIMPKGTIGNLVIQKLGFKYNGWGIASTLYAMFSKAANADYFSNSRALNNTCVEFNSIHLPRRHGRLRWVCEILGPFSWPLVFWPFKSSCLSPNPVFHLPSLTTKSFRIKSMIGVRRLLPIGFRNLALACNNLPL